MANSNATWDACGVCDGDNSSCTDCQGNIIVGFVNNGTCGMFSTLLWSSYVICEMLQSIYIQGV